MPDELVYKFIRIGRDTTLEKHAGKPVWYIFNRKSHTAIGKLFWYARWQQWVATFSEDSVWSAGCLADVQDAIKKLGRKPVTAPLFQETER